MEASNELAARTGIDTAVVERPFVMIPRAHHQQIMPPLVSPPAVPISSAVLAGFPGCTARCLSLLDVLASNEFLLCVCVCLVDLLIALRCYVHLDGGILGVCVCWGGGGGGYSSGRTCLTATTPGRCRPTQHQQMGAARGLC